ncbi:hypothetical protein [Alkanindiges illinoisensis]|uniref:hypothetical protein n=1 Tax=Alkanindiges illinoisensis TaxID=197183 RepID=UPI00047DF81B|nr:hypothetical protein [Alkanindiges illinoisensis]
MNIIQILGGYTAAKRILLDKPAGAIYWDQVESAYVKNFTVNNSDEFEWQYLDVSNRWNYCNSKACPVTNGDFVELAELHKLVKLTTNEYLNQYYKAIQESLNRQVCDQVLINVVEAKHVRKAKRHTAFWLGALALLVVFTLIVRGCLWQQ